MNRSAQRAGRGTGTSRRRELFLGYSTNVHRGENLPQVYRFLRDYTIPVRKRVFGRGRSGLELRFGIQAARDLTRKPERERFREFLDEAGLDLFSINAFPLKNFQAKRVKQDVYTPDWRSRERVIWTQRICESFADLLPDGRAGSVSTLGGTYRFWSDTKATRDRMAKNYLEVLATLEDIAQGSGKDVVLAAEPEPDTTFEIAGDVIRFVEDHLLPCAFRLWKGRYRSRGAIEEAVRRRFTVNLDTCHFSVVFHSPAEAVDEFLRAGLRIGKLHVTNALSLRNPHGSPKSYGVLRAMHEPRYLHQFAGIDSIGEICWRGRDLDDLPRRLSRDDSPDVAEIRTHFHVPLYLKRWKSLRTTQDDTLEALRRTVQRGCCEHLVLETYTWPVLAAQDRLVAGIAREFRWLRDAVSGAG